MDHQIDKNVFVWKPGSTTKPCPKRPRRVFPSDNEWEAHKEEIIRMYIKDNMSLDWVRQTMQKWYQFEASEKMYKRRFRKWNLRKYFTAKDIPEIERQRATGCQSGHIVLPGGRVRDFRCANSFIKRRAPASPPEVLFHAINTYLDISSPNFIWYKDLQDRMCISKSAGINGRFRLSRFHDRLLVAVNSFTYQNNPAELVRSREVMDQCMDEMKVILFEQDPFLLANIFHLLLQIKNRQPPPDDLQEVLEDLNPDSNPERRELGLVFVEYGRNLTSITLGKSHPLTAVWTTLDKAITKSSAGATGAGKLLADSERDMITNALELILDKFQARVGSHHAASLIMRLHLYSSREDVRWKEVVIDLLKVLETGGAPGKGFSWLKWALEMNDYTQEHVTRVTKFICRLLRARLRSSAGAEDGLLLEDSFPPDPEAELLRYLSSPPTVTDEDYFP